MGHRGLGVGGVLAVLAQAIVKLSSLALEPLIDNQLSPAQGAIYAGWVAANAYMEGYRGFQQRFSPRVVARALHLAQNPHPASVLAAPLYTMSFFHTTRRGLITAWATVLGVTALVLVVRRFDSPGAGSSMGASWSPSPGARSR